MIFLNSLESKPHYFNLNYSTLKTQFKKDFMEESSKDENKYVAFQEKFKKWKDLIVSYICFYFF